MFDLPDTWLTRLYNRGRWFVPDAFLRATIAMLIGEINVWEGDDPWLPRFMGNYFFGEGEKITLTETDVRSVDVFPAIIDFHEESPHFFSPPRIITTTRSSQLFSVASLGEGNLTLGEFFVDYRGEVDPACSFNGYFRVSDKFDFNWRRWGERNKLAEYKLRVLTLVTSGLPFSVDSEWIEIEQSDDESTANW
jgi:hypothetical protein